MLRDQQDTVSSLYHRPLNMTNIRIHHKKTLHILIELQKFSTSISCDTKPQSEALLMWIYLSTSADLSVYLSIHLQPFPFPKSAWNTLFTEKEKNPTNLCQSKQLLQGLHSQHFPHNLYLLALLPVNQLSRKVAFCRLTGDLNKKVISILFSECNLCLPGNPSSLLYNQMVTNRKQ